MVPVPSKPPPPPPAPPAAIKYTPSSSTSFHPSLQESAPAPPPPVPSGTYYKPLPSTSFSASPAIKDSFPDVPEQIGTFVSTGNFNGIPTINPFLSSAGGGSSSHHPSNEISDISALDHESSSFPVSSSGEDGVVVKETTATFDHSHDPHYSDDPLHVMRVMLTRLYYGDLDKLKNRPKKKDGRPKEHPVEATVFGQRLRHYLF